MKFWQAALIALALCPAVLFTGCASSSDSQPAGDAQSASAAPQSSVSPTIAYIAGEFNPYLNGTTLTIQNAGLLFEPLVRITPDLEPEYRLAQSVDSSGLSVVIRLRDGCCFADGTAVTAGDVAASLDAARASAAYGGRFAHVTEVLAQDDGAVTLTLDEPDSLFAYLLDVPILKAGELALARPTAGGRYTYAESGDALVKNPLAPFAEAGPDTILLTAVTSYDGLVSGLAMGTLDLYVAPENTVTGGSIVSTETYFKTNELVFLGINSYSQNPLCNTAAGRALLSSLLDRRDIGTKCYYSRAYAATGALNGFYPCIRGQQSILATADSSGLDAVMAQLVFSPDPGTGLYTDPQGQPASVRLLTCGDNTYKRYTANLIQEQWAEYGISVVIEEIDGFEDYLTAVQSGEFELYIGEMKLYNNMDLSAFWNGGAGAGISCSETLAAAYAAFRANAGAAPQLEAAFAAEMPFIPLLWKNGAVVAGQRVGGLEPSLSDPFYSLARLRVTE